MTADLLRQLRGAEREDEEVQTSEIAAYIEGRSLRASVFEGETENIELNDRNKPTDWDEISTYLRKQFPHGSRLEAVGEDFRCTQRTATPARIEELLKKPANHMAQDLCKSKEILRVRPDMWEKTDEDRERPPGGNGWSVVVIAHTSTEEKSRMKLLFFDPQATRRICEECTERRWESEEECGCEAPVECAPEWENFQLEEVKQILKWMLQNPPHPAIYNKTAIGTRSSLLASRSRRIPLLYQSSPLGALGRVRLFRDPSSEALASAPRQALRHHANCSQRRRTLASAGGRHCTPQEAQVGPLPPPPASWPGCLVRGKWQVPVPEIHRTPTLCAPVFCPAKPNTGPASEVPGPCLCWSCLATVTASHTAGTGQSESALASVPLRRRAGQGSQCRRPASLAPVPLSRNQDRETPSPACSHHAPGTQLGGGEGTPDKLMRGTSMMPWLAHERTLRDAVVEPTKVSP